MALVFFLGVIFYGFLNLLFKFHLIADDFSYQHAYWANIANPTLESVVGKGMALRQPIYILQYILIRLSPESTNLYYFLFQLLHIGNGIFLGLLVERRLKPMLAGDVEGFRFLGPVTALLFIFYCNNFEILFWRSCLFYQMGLMLALAGMIWFSWASAVLWVLGYVIYESFLFLPLLAGGFIFFQDRKKIKTFLLVYGVSLVLYGIWRVGTSILGGVEFSRYPIELGFMGGQFFKRMLNYFIFHFSIRGSQKDYELLSWVFRLLVLMAAWRNRAFLKENWRVLALLGLSYLVCLAPVSLIGHFSPRGSFAASALFCAMLALALLPSPKVVLGSVVALFVAGQVLGGLKADYNSKLYLVRVDAIRQRIINFDDSTPTCLEIKNFKSGYRKEWFMQIGFSTGLLNSQLKAEFPDKAFLVADDCSGQDRVDRLDFLSRSPGPNSI